MSIRPQLVQPLAGVFEAGIGGDNRLEIAPRRRRLAQGGGQDTSPTGANLTGGAGVNLRGLGALSTLVLVNGRRVASSGQFGDFVDISNIPVAAIERIEILRDGAHRPGCRRNVLLETRRHVDVGVRY